MHRVLEWISCSLASFGIAFFVFSILLVPQQYSLAQTGAGVCNGMACNLSPCTTYFVLNNNCPNTCLSGGLQKYCQCVTDPTNCSACSCKKNPVQDVCDCLQ